jgi:hypothetical protein
MERWYLFIPGGVFLIAAVIVFALPDRLRMRLHGRVHKQIDGQVVEWPEADVYMGWAFLLTGALGLNAAITCFLTDLALRHAWPIVLGTTTLVSLASVVVIEHLFSGAFPRKRRFGR